VELTSFILGLIGIWFGAHLAVDQALIIADKLKISKLFIGLTVLSIGTSLPEIFTHIISSFNELKGVAASNIAIGTNIGSNIFQITFIIGILGLMSVIKSSKSIQKRDGLVMLSSIAIVYLFGQNGIISQLEGAILLGLYFGYIYYLYTNEKELKHKYTPLLHKLNMSHHIGLLLSGIFVLSLSANIVVSGALKFSELLGIEQSFFGLLIIGVATGLPEFTTALMGVMRKAKEISLGVLIGSNITNPMMGIGIGAIITDNPISKTIINFDIPFWFVTSAVLLLLFQKDHKLNKNGAILMLMTYLGYLIYKINSVII
jgi:cation:H+ antiporter